MLSREGSVRFADAEQERLSDLGREQQSKTHQPFETGKMKQRQSRVQSRVEDESAMFQYILYRRHSSPTMAFNARA